MGSIDITPAALEAAAATVALDQPIVMINLVHFRAGAHYERATNLPPCSGKEAYLQRYAPDFVNRRQSLTPARWRQPAERTVKFGFWEGSRSAPIVPPPVAKISLQ